MNQQLKYNGIIDIAHIRNQGWPVRLHFDDFINKYLLTFYADRYSFNQFLILDTK